MFDGPANASLSASVAAAQIPPSYSAADEERLSSAYDDVQEIERQADTVAALAAQDTLVFAQYLSGRLADIGARTGRAIIFAILPDGSVGVVGAHADKVKLEQLFQDDRELFSQFHQVARQNDMVASAEICRRYLEDSYNAHGETARMAVWRRYRALCDQMESMAGRLILASGQLLSGALQFTHTALAQS